METEALESVSEEGTSSKHFRTAEYNSSALLTRPLVLAGPMTTKQPNPKPRDLLVQMLASEALELQTEQTSKSAKASSTTQGSQSNALSSSALAGGVPAAASPWNPSSLSAARALWPWKDARAQEQTRGRLWEESTHQTMQTQQDLGVWSGRAYAGSTIAAASQPCQAFDTPSTGRAANERAFNGFGPGSDILSTDGGQPTSMNSLPHGWVRDTTTGIVYNLSTRHWYRE